MPAVALAALVVCPWVAADEPAGSVYLRGGAPAPTAAPAAEPQADPEPTAPPAAPVVEESAEDRAARAERVVAAALAGLARAPSVSARIRHRVRFDGVIAKGHGRYVQSGLGEDQRYRYEYRLTTGVEECEILDVCDGLFAWNFRRIGPYPATVDRIEVRRVRERLESLGIAHRKDLSAHLGGVQRHLALLRQHFRFHAITSAAIDEVPVWLVDGGWDRDVLAWLLPDRVEAIRSPEGLPPEELPDGMPFAVRVSISKRELFPCRIEWLAVPGERPVAAAPPEVVAVLEFYDIRIGDPVDASAFVYKPAMEGLNDITDGYIPQVFPLRP